LDAFASQRATEEVDVCVCSLAIALQNPPRDDDDCFDEIFINAEEENAGKSLTIVPTNSNKKFHFFYSQGEVKHLPNDFVFPHMTLCALVTNWFCRNPTTKTLPLKFLVLADFKNRGIKCEHQKMKVLMVMGAVIAGSKQLGLWDGQNGTWDIPRAIDYMKVCGIYLNTQAKQRPVRMIRSAGGLFTIYT
jgi:hypothetical protein